MENTFLITHEQLEMRAEMSHPDLRTLTAHGFRFQASKLIQNESKNRQVLIWIYTGQAMTAWPETQGAANAIVADDISPQLGCIEERPESTETGLGIKLWKISAAQCRRELNYPSLLC